MAAAVTVDFNANLIKFNEQVDKAVARLDGFQRNAESMSSKVNASLASLGIGLSLGGLAAFVKSGVDAADALNDMSDRTGIAVEKLAGLQLATKLANTDMEAFQAASNKLAINMAKNGEAFAKLGIDAKDPAEAFIQLADVFSSIEDPQKRAAFGAAALGKSWAEMAPLLAQGGAALRATMEEGRQMSGITAEQAKQAAALNDELDKMNTRMSVLSMTVSGPAVNALSAWTQGIMFAIEQTKGFHPLDFLDAGGYAASGKASQLDYINKKINETSEALNNLRNTGPKNGETVISDIKALEQEMQRLSKARDELSKPIEPPKPPVDTASEIFDRNLKALFAAGDAENKLAKNAESAAKSAARSEETRRKAVDDTIASLQRDIEISALSEDQQRRAIDLSNSLKNARGGEIQTITDLVNAKYNQIEVDRRQSAQWQQLIEDANAYYDLNKSIADFAKSDISTSSFGDLIAKTRSMLDAGIIDEAQAKASFDKLGQAYNDGFVEPAMKGNDKISAFTEQAARNMQSAFADFLFDPFSKGVDGMASAFANTVKRMAAEAASAQLMNALFGEVGSSGSRNWSSGLLGALFSSAASGFANGGIMTSSGPIPLHAYASGGVANSPQLALFGEGRMSEAYVPLPDGRSIPVTMKGNSGNTYNVQINVEGGRNPDETGQRVGEAFVRAIAREEISNQARAGNSLNPTTRF